MCSQPPLAIDDSEAIEEHLRLVDLIKDVPQAMGITGGEPLLLGDGLVRILVRLKDRLPRTHVQMLTNGRLYAYDDVAERLASVRHTSFISAIPLYSDVASEHDYVVQAAGAFDQTVGGVYNATRHGLAVEIRVVLHRETIARLRQLGLFIYRNFPLRTPCRSHGT